MYSPIDGMKTKRNAATSPARRAEVIFRNAFRRLAPRSVAASSSLRSMFSSAMKIGRQMNGTHAYVSTIITVNWL